MRYAVLAGGGAAHPAKLLSGLDHARCAPADRHLCPSRHRVTFAEWSWQILIRDSTALVERSVRANLNGTWHPFPEGEVVTNRLNPSSIKASMRPRTSAASRLPSSTTPALDPALAIGRGRNQVERTARAGKFELLFEERCLFNGRSFPHEGGPCQQETRISLPGKSPTARTPLDR